MASAFSAVLIYRLVSWVFIAAIGWLLFFFLYRNEYRNPAARRESDV